MATQAEHLLDRLDHHGITAQLAADGTVTLDGLVTERAIRIVRKHEAALRGLLAYRRHEAGGDPSAWCWRCGADVTQFTPDGTAWCDPCLVAHTARTVLQAFPDSELVKEGDLDYEPLKETTDQTD